MSSLLVASVQFRSVPGDVASNVSRMVQHVEKAAAHGAGLVLFPEMSDTGYVMDAILRDASPWDRGPLVLLAEAAARHRIVVVAGLSERTDVGVYNSVAVIDTDGRLRAKHRKTHLMRLAPVLESSHLEAGNELVTFVVDDFRFGIVVCYEIRFPEIARALAVAGAEVLLVPAAFPAARRDHWRALTTARAIENQAYVVAANRVGIDDGMAHAGASRALDPWGEVLAEGPDEEETILWAPLERARLERVRSGLRVFEDRRPDVYRAVGDVGIIGGTSRGFPR